MPYVAPTTVSTGDVYQASAHNVIVNDVIDLRSYQNRFAQYRYTGGAITLTSNSTWADIPTIGTALDFTLNASTGDVIEYGVNFIVSSSAVSTGWDVFTIVGSTATNTFSTGAAATTWATQQGCGGWFCGTSVEEKVTGSAFYTLQSGDISSGTVKLRLRYSNSSATTRLLYASTQNPFMVFARNLGPVTS